MQLTRPSRVLSIILATTICLLLLVAWKGVCVIPFGVGRLLLPSERCVVAIPGTSKSIVYWRKSISFMIGEFSRGVSVCDAIDAGVFHPLAMDTGRVLYVNVYSIYENGRHWLRFADQAAEHLLDVDNDIMYLVVHTKDRAWAIRFDHESDYATREKFYGGYERVKNERTGEKAIALDSMITDMHGHYLGALEGNRCGLQFYDEVMRHEKPIKRRDEFY